MNIIEINVREYQRDNKKKYNPEKLVTRVYTRRRKTTQKQSRETGNKSVHKTKKNNTKTIQRNW